MLFNLDAANASNGTKRWGCRWFECEIQWRGDWKTTKLLFVYFTNRQNYILRVRKIIRISRNALMEIYTGCYILIYKRSYPRSCYYSFKKCPKCIFLFLFRKWAVICGHNNGHYYFFKHPGPGQHSEHETRIVISMDVPSS